MSRLATSDSVTPFLNDSLQQQDQESSSLPEILKALKRLIEQYELSPLDRSQLADLQIQPSYCDSIIEKIEKFILFNRACSCAFRFKSTNHAGLEIFQIARAQDAHYVNIVTTVSAMLFFLTDAGVTVATTKNSVAMLKNLLSEVKAILNSLRDEAGGLPLFRIILLFILLPGGMWGAFNKGFVGIQSVSELIAAFITSHPPSYLGVVFRVMGAVVGGSSALCFAAFNLRNGLGILRTLRALFSSELWQAYFHAEKKRIYVDQLITFLISIAMTLITLLATFYAKGSFEITWSVASEALFIGLSNLTLNTFFTTGPNYIIKTIKSHCNTLETHRAEIETSGCHRAGMMGLQTVGVISSLGNSFAVLPAILFILSLVSKERDLTKQSIVGLVIALAIWMLLAVPMFARDFAYYTKPLLEWLEKKNTQSRASSSVDVVATAPVSEPVVAQNNSRSLFSFFSGFFSKKSADDSTARVNLSVA